LPGNLDGSSYDTAWPLFFRAFDAYKNSVYIYLPAAVFKFNGPCTSAARMLSAMLGVVAALLPGLPAERMTRRKGIGVIVCFSALLTPWLYENSRLVLALVKNSFAFNRQRHEFRTIE
jgi:hypothetical protein